MPTVSPDWDGVFRALEAWRRALIASQSGVDPSVTTVAERYRKSPWAVLVSTIISLRTKDSVTLPASKRLLERAPGPAELAALKTGTIEKLIYPAGFYRVKAANLKDIAGILLAGQGGKVPANLEALLALPGVGRKTANLVLVEAFGLPGICVDIHVHRISHRLGWLESPNPDATELILRRILPKKYWKKINYLLVLYGQHICRPVSPFCSRCVIAADCPARGVGRKR
jgi:endonuclease-3